MGASPSGPACIHSIRHHDAAHSFLALRKTIVLGACRYMDGVVHGLNHLHLGFWASAAGKKWLVAQAPQFQSIHCQLGRLGVVFLLGFANWTPHVYCHINVAPLLEIRI